MAAKIATRNKPKQKTEEVELFTVVKAGTLDPVYLPRGGVTREVAERLSSGLVIPSEVVPVESL